MQDVLKKHLHGGDTLGGLGAEVHVKLMTADEALMLGAFLGLPKRCGVFQMLDRGYKLSPTI